MNRNSINVVYLCKTVMRAIPFFQKSMKNVDDRFEPSHNPFKTLAKEGKS